MAITDFAKLDPNVPLPQASVRRIGSGWDTPVGTAVRDDRVTHHPLFDPASLRPGWSPPEPPKPSEHELRTQLVDALDVQHIADTALADAAAAHDRARRHLERCGHNLDGYRDLDAELTAATAAMLRDDDGELRERDGLMARTVERERARLAYASAAAAGDLLQGELVQARGKAAEAAARADRLIASVLTFTAEAVAEKHEALLAEAAAVRETLLAFDHYIAGKGTGLLSSRVRNALGNDMAAFTRRHDKTAWIAAAARLRQDPMCEVSVGAEPLASEG